MVMLRVLVAVGVLGAVGDVLRADDAAPTKAVTAVPQASEQAALAFAEKHHAELAGLLRQLKRTEPGEFAAAVAEISRTSDRLEKLREKQPEKYDAALREWQLTSRIRLIVARMAMTKDPTLEQELRDVVRERLELRLLPLRAEAERIEKRLEKIRGTIADHDRDPDASVERELATLKSGVVAAQHRVKARKAGQPAEGTPAEAVRKPSQP